MLKYIKYHGYAKVNFSSLPHINTNGNLLFIAKNLQTLGPLIRIHLNFDKKNLGTNGKIKYTFFYLFLYRFLLFIEHSLDLIGRGLENMNTLKHIDLSLRWNNLYKVFNGL